MKSNHISQLGRKAVIEKMCDRLKEIIDEYQWSVDNSMLPRLPDSEIEWLIEQAKRVALLEQRNKRISDTALEQIDITQQRNERLEKKVERYEKALKDIQKCADFEDLVQEICENALKN